jgi:hypothetical protein
MARHPTWFERLDALLGVVRESRLYWLGRNEIGIIFQCSERDSIRLLHKFGATERNNVLSLARPALLTQLEAVRSGSTYAVFVQQRQEIAVEARNAGAEADARQFRVRAARPPAPPIRLADLPPLSTGRVPSLPGAGRFEILYDDGADLMWQLGEFLRAAGTNRAEYRLRHRARRIVWLPCPGSVPATSSGRSIGCLSQCASRRSPSRIWPRRRWPPAFSEYVETAASRNLNLDIEWLPMAATLIQWKSLSLLPGGQRVAADPIRDELVRQLAVHRKEAAAAMRQPGRNPKGYAVQTIEYGIAQVITSLKRCQHTFLPHLEPKRNGAWNFFASKARVWSALSRRPKAGPPSPETIFVCPTSGRSCLSNC